MEKLQELKKWVERAFEEFFLAPSYDTEEQLRSAIGQYRRAHRELTDENNF